MAGATARRRRRQRGSGAVAVGSATVASAARWQRWQRRGKALATAWRRRRERGGSGGGGVSTPAVSSLAAAAAAWRQCGILLTRLERGPWCAVSIVMVVSGRGDLRSEVLGLMFLRCALGTFFGTRTDDSKTQLRSFWGKKRRKSPIFFQLGSFFPAYRQCLIGPYDYCAASDEEYNLMSDEVRKRILKASPHARIRRQIGINEFYDSHLTECNSSSNLSHNVDNLQLT